MARAVRIPTADTAAAAANIHGEVSKPAIPKHFIATDENTALHAHPTEPQARMRGKDEAGAWDIAIAEATDQVGIKKKSGNKPNQRSLAK